MELFDAGSTGGSFTKIVEAVFFRGRGEGGQGRREKSSPVLRARVRGEGRWDKLSCVALRHGRCAWVGARQVRLSAIDYLSEQASFLDPFRRLFVSGVFFSGRSLFRVHSVGAVVVVLLLRYSRAWKRGNGSGIAVVRRGYGHASFFVFCPEF